MQKTLLKISSVLSLVCALLIGSSLTIDARTVLNDVRIYGNSYSYQLYQEYDQEYYDYGSRLDFSSITAYINDGTAGAQDSIDTSVPTFLVCDATYHSNSNAIPMSNYCIPFDQITDIEIIVNGTVNTRVDVIDTLMGITTNAQYLLSGVTYKTLYQLGYRITASIQTTYTGGNCYLYVLNKLTGSPRITFVGNVDNTTTNVYNEEHYIIYSMWRVSFNTYTLRDTNNNNSLVEVNFNKNFIYIQDINTVPGSSIPYNWDNYYIYATNDCVLTNYHDVYDSNNNVIGKTYSLYITGPNPYYELLYKPQTYNNSTLPSQSNSSINFNRLCSVYTAQSSDVSVEVDMSETNDILLEIKDLLSDFEVQEINNIYNEFITNYDVDLNLEINNYVDIFKNNFRDLDFDDPKVSVNNTDIQKVGNFKIIFSKMLKTMDDSGLTILYFLPIVLLIIGAIV